MSLYSSVKSSVKKGVKAVGSALSAGLSSVGSALGLTGGKNNVATAIAPSRNQTLVPNISTPQGIGQTQPNGSITLLNAQGRPTGSVLGSSGIGSTPLPSSTSPTTISSRPLSGGGSPTANTASFNISPTMAADSLGGSVLGASTSGFSPTSTSTGTVGSGGMSAPGTSAVSYPTVPNYQNVGKTDSTAIAGHPLSDYNYDPATGTFVLKTQGADALAAGRKKTFDDLKSMIPTKQDLYANPEVIAQQNEVNRNKQIVNDLTAQLNNIVVKQNEALASVRGVGAVEGVTETVFGQQEANINRNYAMMALPVQAQIAVAQGNLGLAQDYLSQTTKIISEHIDNSYQYQKDIYNWAAQYATGEDKIKLDAYTKENDRSYQEKRDTINFAQSLLMKEGTSASVITQLSNLLKNPDAPSFASNVVALAGQVNSSSDGGASSFVDVMQQAIDAGATPEQAAREAATVSENSGVPVDQKVLSSWVSQARQLKKAPASVATPAPVKEEVGLIGRISNFLFGQ